MKTLPVSTNFIHKEKNISPAQPKQTNRKNESQ